MRSDTIKTIGIFLGTCVIALVVIFGAVTMTGKGKGLGKRLQLGQKYLTEAKYEEAVIVFQKILKTDPKQMEAYAGIAQAFEEMNKKEDALPYLEQALTVVEKEYDRSDKRFEKTQVILTKLALLYDEKSETEKAQHVRKILKEKGFEEEETEPDTAQESTGITVARPDLTKMKLEQVISYLYWADGGKEKQWEISKLTEEDAGKIISACVNAALVLSGEDQLGLSEGYEENGGEIISRETAVRLLKGIGIPTSEINYENVNGIREENGAIISDAPDYSEFRLYSHIVNMIPEKDGSLVLTGNVGWTAWEVDSDVNAKQDPGFVEHFKAVLARTEDDYLDGYVFTHFECGAANHNGEYSISYDASGEKDGFVKVLQSLYQKPQLYMKNASWLENVQFTVADVNQDDKTELLISFAGESEEDTYYGIWQWNPQMKQAYMVDKNRSGAAYFGVNRLMQWDDVSGNGVVIYKYDMETGRYLFLDSAYKNEYGNEQWSFDRVGKGEINIEERDAILQKYLPQDQQFDLQWKKLTQENIDDLKKNGIWTTGKMPPQETAAAAETAADPGAGEMTAFADFLKKALAAPKTYLDPDASTDGMYDNSFVIADVNQDGKKELLIEYQMDMGPGLLTGVWQWDAGSGDLVLKNTFGGSGQYYKNGVVTVDVAHNHTYGSVIWPYTVYIYNAGTGTYEDFAYAYCADTDWGTDSGAYKAEEDLDHDGVIYYFRTGQDMERPITEGDPLTEAQYNALIEKYMPENQKLTLNWQPLTAENIEKLTR